MGFEFLRLYPRANILVTTKKDFETGNRKKFCGRIATGDYDAVIIGHSQFEKIPMSIERQQEHLEKQIDEIEHGIDEASFQRRAVHGQTANGETKKSLQAKLDKLNDQSGRTMLSPLNSSALTGFSLMKAIIIRILYLYTKMRNVAVSPRPKRRNPATSL